MHYAVIMAGGSGTRFWPKGTKAVPKQLLPLYTNQPLIKDTLDRLETVFGSKEIFIGTGKKLAAKIKKILPKANFIIEPCARNTMGCIGLVTAEIYKKDPEAIIFVQPSDHVYTNLKKYQKYVKQALKLAETGKIVTIGIKPSSPSTAFGYIKQGKPYQTGFIVDTFKEKPDRSTAKKFIQSGKYHWNAGLYCFKAKIMLKELEQHAPAVYKPLQAILKGKNKEKEFAKLPSISIDYALAEKSSELVVVAADMPWDDVGSWDSMQRIHKQDKSGNTVVGKYLQVESTGNVIFSESLVATIGMKDVVIVQTKNITLVCPKERAEEVKKIVQQLKDKNMNEFL